VIIEIGTITGVCLPIYYLAKTVQAWDMALRVALLVRELKDVYHIDFGDLGMLALFDI